MLLNATLTALLRSVEPAPDDWLVVPVRLCVAEYADATWHVVTDGDHREWVRTGAGGTIRSGALAGDLVAANEVWEPARIAFLEDFGAYLGHELGHALLLGHGDGIDQGPIIGSEPPTAGPRPFDEYCDPAEPQESCSLMDPVYARCTELTALQIELARAAAAARDGTTIQATGPGCNNESCQVGERSPAWALLLVLAGWRRRRGSVRNQGSAISIARNENG